LLCQFTAEATGRPVMAGPSEATAVGNILGQALALGQVHSLAEIREISRKSTDLTFYEPRQTLAWEAAYQRFRHMQKSAT
jgi:rhamnulokinase